MTTSKFLNLLVDFYSVPLQTDLDIPLGVNPVWQRERERVLTVFSRFSATIGTLAILVAQYNVLSPLTFTVFALFLLLFWVIAIFRQINYNTRLWGFLFVLLCTAISEVLSYGFSVEYFLFFMTFVVASAALSSRRQAIISFLIAVVTLLVSDYLIGSRIFIPFVDTEGYRPATPVSGLTMIAVFIACVSAVGAAIIVLTESLNKAWVKEFEALQALQIERDHLEERVKDRTQALAAARDQANKDNEELRTYFHAIEQSGNTIIIMDEGGRIKYVNPKFTASTGYSPADALGKTVPSLMREDYREDDFQDEAWWNAVNNGQTWYGEFENQRKNGSILWESAVITPVHNQDGEIVNFIEIKQDITEQKILEQQIQQQNDYLSIFQEIAFDLLNRRDMNELFQVIVERSSILLFSPYSELMIEENGYLVVKAATGEHSGRILGETVTREQAKLSWQAFDTKEPVFLENYMAWDEHRPEYEAYQIYAVAEFPILIGKQCVGILSIGRDVPGYPYTPEQIQTGMQFARLMALILDNARLYESAMEEISQRKEFEDRLFNQNQYLAILHKTAVEMLQRSDDVDTLLGEIVNNASELVGALYGIIFLYEGENMVPRAVTEKYSSHIGLSEKMPGAGVLKRVWEDAKPFVLTDYSEWEGRDRRYEDHEFRAFAGVPIIGRSGLLGVLQVSRVGDDRREFTPQEVEIFIQFAVFASVILDNAQVYERAKNEISERKRAEALLVESENRFRQFVESASDAIYRTDMNGNFTYVNPTALSMMGYEREDELLGQNYLDVIFPAFRDQVRRFYLRQAASGERNTYFEFPAINNNGGTIWFGQNVQLLEFNGNVTGFQAVARDITRLKEVQDALVLSRDQALAANRFKTQLISLVSHELRTPLGGILGFAELLRYKAFGKLNNKQEEAVVHIIESSNFLAETINQLLDQAQMESRSLSLHYEYFDPFDMLEKIAPSLSVLADKNGLSFAAEISTTVPKKLYGDRYRIQQIITNLTGNAIKFTKQGSVEILVTSMGADQWKIEVSDTGVGIPSNEFENVFEPFKQINNPTLVSSKGSGLGLSIVKQLVDLMNGRIELQSEVGVGTKFIVTLPLLNPQGENNG